MKALPETQLQERIRLSDLFAAAYRANQDPTTAALHLGEALRISEQHQVAQTPERYLQLAALFGKNERHKTRDLLEKAIILAKTNGPSARDWLPACLAAYGEWLGSIGENEEGLQALNQALDAFELDGNQPKPSFSVIEVLRERARLAARLLDFEQTISAMQRAHALLEKAGAAFDEIASVKLQLGDHFRYFGQLDQAETVYKELLDHARQDEGASLRTALLLNRIGFVVEQKREYQQAIERYLQALEVQKQFKAPIQDLQWTAERIENCRWAYAMQQRKARQEKEEPS